MSAGLPAPADLQTSTSALSDEAVIALIRRHRQLAAEVSHLQGEMAQIKDTIDAAVAVGWKLDVDGVPAGKRAGNREFCRITAISLLSEEQKVACRREMYVDKLIRIAVTEAGLLEQCLVEKPDSKPVLKLV